jgi:hypothetical protein
MAYFYDNYIIMNILDGVMFILCIFIIGCITYSNANYIGSEKNISNYSNPNYIGSEKNILNYLSTSEIGIYNTNVVNTLSEISNLNIPYMPHTREENIKISRQFDSLLNPASNVYPKIDSCDITDFTKGSSYNVSF